MKESEAPALQPAAAENPEVNARAESDHDADTNSTLNGARGVKRPAADDIGERDGKRPAPHDLVDEHEDNDQTPRDTDTSQPVDASSEPAPMTKSQLKKLKRKQRYEDNKENRKLKRRDKRHERSARKRVEKEEEIAAATAEGREPVLNNGPQRHKSQRSSKVPVAIIVDCKFEKYMLEQELVSLASQVTRCYSDNRGAQHPVHLYVSSYGGFLQQRHETVLENQHVKWKGIRFSKGDFIQTANEAKEYMAGPKGGERIELLQQSLFEEPVSLASPPVGNTKKAKRAPIPEPEAEDVDKSIVYLTADSPYTLNCLEPNTCYVVGGIIDKNREKGLCYKVAREKKVRTAKLPIGEYMVLQHRHILATNHVVEIMLKWLELGDWGAAFMAVIPTRKGGKLKTDEDTPTESVEGETAEEPEKEKAKEKARVDVEIVDTTQSGAQENSTKQSVDDLAEVEGDNAEEGLQNNTLAEQRWSAPPPELETAMEEKGEPTNGNAS
ncbi:hypothetical protein HD806DRAFT_373484 [Xylariaceae sp. AK1471]|nr:hypothetical protein HD806DRAFT_373484 [Xylariaceae sp. AK1471]